MAVPLADHVVERGLVALLADGATHPVARLAEALGTDEGGLVLEVEGLRRAGIEVLAAAGPGYRLRQRVELLDAARIRAAMQAHPDGRAGPAGRAAPAAPAERIHSLETLFEVDSTNTRLLLLEPPPAGLARVCCAELQRAGRGRRGRAWISPFGGSLALSFGWRFRQASAASPALSLAVGVAVARAATRFGAGAVRLKWPNDIWLEDRKLGGVLIELRSDAQTPAYAVIGIGINLTLPPEGIRRRIEAQGVRLAALNEACPAAVSRNALAATLIEELLSMLDEFEERGFAAFHAEWSVGDALRGRRARVQSPDGLVEGTACGADTDGALVLEVAGARRRYVSGDVSLRLDEEGA